MGGLLEPVCRHLGKSQPAEAGPAERLSLAMTGQHDQTFNQFNHNFNLFANDLAPPTMLSVGSMFTVITRYSVLPCLPHLNSSFQILISSQISGFQIIISRYPIYVMSCFVMIQWVALFCFWPKLWFSWTIKQKSEKGEQLSIRCTALLTTES